MDGIKRTALAAFVLLFAAGGTAGDALAVCAKREDMLKELSRSFGEQPRAAGLATTGVVIEILTSAEGTWTILQTFPDGESCVAMTGDAWDAPMPGWAGTVAAKVEETPI